MRIIGNPLAIENVHGTAEGQVPRVMCCIDTEGLCLVTGWLGVGCARTQTILGVGVVLVSMDCNLDQHIKFSRANYRGVRGEIARTSHLLGVIKRYSRP